MWQAQDSSAAWLGLRIYTLRLTVSPQYPLQMCNTEYMYAKRETSESIGIMSVSGTSEIELEEEIESKWDVSLKPRRHLGLLTSKEHNLLYLVQVFVLLVLLGNHLEKPDHPVAQWTIQRKVLVQATFDDLFIVFNLWVISVH